MTQAPSPSIISAISLLDSLVRSGLRQALIAPGSRSAPLAYALAALDRAGVVRSHVRVDERTAAFTALGMAKASGQPVAVITTSGTAVGNCVPALMEAYHSGLPLALISADRPQRLQGSGANQTTRQVPLAPAHLRAQISLENYSADPADPQTSQLNLALAALTGRDPGDWSRPSGQPVGPVQINLGLDLPLTPNPADQQILTRWADSLRPLLGQPVKHPRKTDPTASSWLRGQESESSSPFYRTLVIAGDGAGPMAQDFAQQLGLPLVAEPSSGARLAPSALPAYPQLLAHSQLTGQIQRLVLFGHPTLSRPVAQLLADLAIPVALYEPEPAPWHEPEALPYQTLDQLADLAAFAGGGAASGAEGLAWQEAWRREAQECYQSLLTQAGLANPNTETAPGQGLDPQNLTSRQALALAAWQACLADDSILMLGSSSLIRDLDSLAPVAALAPRVYANRGLAGIDGTIATAAGISLATGRPVRLLLGDLTFLHDVSSLNIGPLEEKPQLEIWVYDDQGGGIFAGLEHGQLAQQAPAWAPAVQRFFTTPHQASLEQLAGSWGQNGIQVRVFPSE